MEQVIAADTQIEDAARFNTVRIMIVVFSSCLRQGEKGRGSYTVARSYWCAKSRCNSAAGKSNRSLLSWAKCRGFRYICNASDQSAIVAPTEVDELFIIPPLIPD